MKKQKILDLLIGSNNAGKIKEIKDLLPRKIKVVSANQYKLKSPKENGSTFAENSLIKAKYFSKKTNKLCLADDSGLEIDILAKMPGIYSARWGGKKNNFNVAIQKVFNKLQKINPNWKKEKISARFVCALTIYGPRIKTIKSIGKIEGTISKKKKRKKWFWL
tara:strand:- start:445 stop:933 length:489 start_codon:yes stop_codon:yes gene_type:complete